MRSQEAHLSDETLLLALDGELAATDEERVRSHLAACWDCRTRKQEIEATIGEFMRLHRLFDTHIPPSAGPRALLKAQMVQLAEARRTSCPHWFHTLCATRSWVILGAACVLACVAYLASHRSAVQHTQRMIAVTAPNPNLTPGATVLVTRGEVCKESSTNNKAVPLMLQRRVFEEYGIRSSDPAAYEIDYLVTPALGGSDDIHNLWPQSRRTAVWSAEVKDALEDHLRKLVCDGQLDLDTAQREIAKNWIEAYKKYFHTDQPLTRFR